MRARIAIVGDLDPRSPLHAATTRALAPAADGADAEWLATEAVPAAELADYDGFLIAPGSPYRSVHGALDAIRHARERGVPLVGT